jgi:NADH-quinone oxidoreductase subunit N
VLGSFSSCILLLGFSVIYSITGSTTFEVIQALTIVKTYNFDFLMFGFIFSFTAFLFKVGAVPFHMWLCDVYEGAISPVTMFFALIPKIIIFYVLLKILFCVFASEYVV